MCDLADIACIAENGHKGLKAVVACRENHPFGSLTKAQIY